MTTGQVLPASGRRDDAVEPILVVRGLSVAYDTGGQLLAAIDDVALELRRRQMLAVIGESGSGKTTLARGILRLLPPNGRVTGGSVELLGERGGNLLQASGSKLRSLRGPGIGFVPQATAGALNPVQRVVDQFRVTLRAHGLRWGDVGRERAEKALMAAGLHDTRFVMQAYAHELSGGMAQRVVVALATVLEPAVLIADEPTSALDVTVQRRLLDNLAVDVRQHDRGVVIITHDIGIARTYCDSVLVMYGGYVLEAGPMDVVLDAPLHPYTRALLAATPARRTLSRLRRVDAAAARSDGKCCPFYAVCPERLEPRCATELPPLRQIREGHFLRSFCDG
jgi:oligopeptide/dipeptide ABC transporter ATP-binding protein